MISLAAVDPLQKVFKETAFFEDMDAVADVAAGEHASFQFAVRSTRQVRKLSAAVVQLSRNTDLINSHSSVGFVGYTRVGRPLPNPSKDKLSPTSGFYPDPILDSNSIDLSGFTTQPIWVTVTIPENMPAGIYSGMLTIKGLIDQQPVTLTRRFAVHVYPVKIQKTRLWVTNWFDLDKTKMKQLSGGKDSVIYSDRYWYWLHVVAKKMKDYDQNVVIVSPLFLSKISRKDGKFLFDFSKFDRFVQTFADEGVLGLIEGGHIGGRMGNWYSQFGVFTPYWKNDTLRFNCIPVTDTAAQAFYSQFIPALVNHLKEKGWDKIYLQHICDEPEGGNEKSYGEIAGYIKSLAPGIRTIDAVHTHGVNNTVDVWVPQLDFFNTDYSFYKDRKAAGDEIWFYTCLAPQGEYANRFIELPLIKTRILHWINFRFGATGYLHWGWNFWSSDPLSETSGIIPEAGNIM
ncbi:MAG TPA: glycoside hydrolase domain-containing protein, partial [Puia sp.]|nr:glycoside hydrolase domain-containing protein [Puia sp.]